MKTKGFKKMSLKSQENNYGGWAWLATAIPLMLQTIMTAVSTYKMIESSKGSVKYNGADAHWENKESKTKSSHTTSKTHTVFYAF